MLPLNQAVLLCLHSWRRHNLSRTAQDLMAMLQLHLPKPNNVPATLYLLNKTMSTEEEADWSITIKASELLMSCDCMHAVIIKFA